MAILNLAEEIGARQLEARRQLVDLAPRLANGEEAIQPEDLIDLAARAGVDAAEFQRLIDLNCELAELRTAADRLDPCGAALSLARREANAWTAETEALVNARRSRAQELGSIAAARARDLSQAQEATKRYQAFLTAHGAELGLEPLDLDGRTLTYRGTVVPLSVRGAPEYEVDRETFEVQSARRRALVADLDRRRQEEHREAFRQWASTRPQTAGGLPLEDERHPAPRRPLGATWADVLEEGLNR